MWVSGDGKVEDRGTYEGSEIESKEEEVKKRVSLRKKINLMGLAGGGEQCY